MSFGIIEGHQSISDDSNKLYLYNEGNECTDITGGWSGGTKNADHLALSGGAICSTANTIDMTGYRYLFVKYTFNSAGSSYASQFVVKVADEVIIVSHTPYQPWFSITENILGDIFNKNGVIKLNTDTTYNPNVKVYSVWLQKDL